MGRRCPDYLPTFLFLLLIFFSVPAVHAEVYSVFNIAPTGTIPGAKVPHIGWTTVGCYSRNTGRWVDCPFTQEILGLKEPDSHSDNNGGHNHPNHPLIEPPDASMQYDQDICPGEKLKVCGTTNFTPMNLITHGIPQASGKIVKKLMIEAVRPEWPYDWWCWFGCDAQPISYTYIDIFHVEVPNLDQLPDPGPNDVYTKIRSDEVRHPDAYFGTSYASELLVLVSENYFVLSGRKLSINDMSLPQGGLFDIRGDWSTPHKEHRLGTSADINREGIHCLDNKQLRIAVDMLVPPVVRRGQARSALLCELPDKPLNEGGGLYHIFLEQTSTVRLF